MTAPSAIDVHAHFFPESFISLLAEDGEPFGARVDRSNPKGPILDVAGSRTVPLDATYWDIDRRVKSMNRARVATHALSLTAPMVYWSGPELARRLARAVNDAMDEAHRVYPDRFVGCATLPMQDPAAALAELERAAKLAGIRGVYLGTNINGHDLSEPSYEPIFAACARLGLPVLLHPLSVIGAQRLKPFYLGNLLGNPFDTAIAAAHLVFGGVLDRHPKLKVCLPHAGGALPYLYGRLRRGQRVRPEARDRARRPFEAYLTRFTYDTISHSPEALRYLVNLVGAERVMVGSDFCFDMGYEKPVDVVEGLKGLTRSDQRLVLSENARKLLRL
jgi:aminocarboxymuconate-semialdehyde decarboxylase